MSLASDLKPVLTDAIRYWELRRLLYNLVLALLTAVYALAGNLPEIWNEKEFLELILVLLVLATLANILYCAAYPIDLLMQLSGFQVTWRRHRIWLFLGGLLIACIIARWTAMGLFTASGF